MNKAISAQYPYESKFIEVMGSKMHYIEQGNGIPVLFLHGTPSWSYLWRNVIPLVNGVARCIAVDMIGHGKSECPDISYTQKNQFHYLESFTEQMQLKDFIIVGHSYGSSLGIAYARKHEINVKACAYLEPMLGQFKQWSDFNPYNPAAQEIFKNFRNPNINEDLLITQNALLEKAFVNSALRTLTDEEKAAYITPFQPIERRKVVWDGGPRNLPIENEPKEFVELVEANFQWMQQTAMPQLFFYTEPAAFFRREKAEKFIETAKNVTGIFLGEGRYSHTEDYPVEIGQALANWILTLNGRV